MRSCFAIDHYWIKVNAGEVGGVNRAGDGNWVLGLPLPGLEKEQAGISEIIAFSLSRASFIDDRSSTGCHRQPQPANLPELTGLCL